MTAGVHLDLSLNDLGVGPLTRLTATRIAELRGACATNGLVYLPEEMKHDRVPFI